MSFQKERRQVALKKSGDESPHSKRWRAEKKRENRLSIKIGFSVEDMKKRALILGGGISGLALAWKLSRSPQEWEVVLLEKSPQVGGWLQSDTSLGYHFEQGPRTFRYQSNSLLLELIDALGLQDALIFSSREAKKRFLWIEEKLQPMPSFYFLRKFLFTLLKERFVAPSAEEETIWDFAVRRFSPQVAEWLFDPIVLGIYAGNVRKLSLQACFPSIKKWESEHGSLIRAFWKEKNKKKEKAALFSLKGGMHSLIAALQQQTQAEICCGQEVKAVKFFENTVEVDTQERRWNADYLFSTLPPQVNAGLLQHLNPEIAELFSSLRSESITVVNLGYNQDLLSQKGFGYLIPSCEKEQVLGVVFDSALFPEQNRREKETRLTVMVRGLPVDAKEIALRAVAKQLRITTQPEAILITQAPCAIPQYEVGHQKKIALLESRMLEHFPRFRLLGNYLQGVSVGDCLSTLGRVIKNGQS